MWYPEEHVVTKLAIVTDSYLS